MGVESGMTRIKSERPTTAKVYGKNPLVFIVCCSNQMYMQGQIGLKDETEISKYTLWIKDNN